MDSTAPPPPSAELYAFRDPRTASRAHDPSAPFGLPQEAPSAYAQAPHSAFGPSPLVGDRSRAQQHPVTPFASTSPSPYADWQHVRQSLPDVQAAPPSIYRQPVRTSSSSSLDRAFEGIARSPSPSPYTPSSRDSSANPAQQGSGPAMSVDLNEGISIPHSPASAALFSPTASLFQGAQDQALGATSTLDSLLAAIAASESPFSTATPATAPSTSAPSRQGSATYAHYPSQVRTQPAMNTENALKDCQWDFITQADDYTSEPRAPYTPSYDSLSLAADDSDSLFGGQWGHLASDASAQHTGSEAHTTPALGFQPDPTIEFSAMPLFSEPKRDDTLRMSAEQAGFGLDGPPSASFTGEALSVSPPGSPSLGAAQPLPHGGTLGPSPLSRLAIPTSATGGEDSMMSAGEETAGPATARPGKPSAEVEKLLWQLTSQSQPSVPSLSVAPATPAGNASMPFAANLARPLSVSQLSANQHRPPNRQRSLSDAAIPQQHSGIDPRMLDALPYSSAASAPSYSPAMSDSALDDSDDFAGRESAAGPRRRSAASAWAEPYSRERRGGVDEGDMRRSRSHHRNAYSEDLAAQIAAAGGSAILSDQHAAYFAQQFGMAPLSAATGASSIPPSPFLPPQQLPPPSNDPDMPGYISLDDPLSHYNGVSALPRHLGGRGRRASDASPTRSSASSANSENGGEIIDDPVFWDSQTTQATKQAAAARRKPGTDAKFICDYCGETFTRAYNLKGHLRAHNGEKPFACDYPGCDKAFARAHDRQRHMQLHTSVARYQCEGCSRCFKRLDALQRHHKSDTGQHCVAKIMADGIMPPFPSMGGHREPVIL